MTFCIFHFFIIGYPSILRWFDEYPLWQGSLQVGSRSNKYCQKFGGQVRYFLTKVSCKLLLKNNKKSLRYFLFFEVLPKIMCGLWNMVILCTAASSWSALPLGACVLLSRDRGRVWSIWNKVLATRKQKWGLLCSFMFGTYFNFNIFGDLWNACF